MEEGTAEEAKVRSMIFLSTVLRVSCVFGNPNRVSFPTHSPCESSPPPFTSLRFIKCFPY